MFQLLENLRNLAPVKKLKLKRWSLAVIVIALSGCTFNLPFLSSEPTTVSPLENQPLEEAVAVVARIQNVTQLRENAAAEWRTAVLAEFLMPLSWLRTLADSSAQMVLQDSSLVALSADTMIHFSNLIADPDALEKGIVIDQGEVWILMGFGRITVSTSLGDATVINGEAKVTLDPLTGDLIVSVLTGSVEFEHISGTQRLLILAGQSIVFSALGQPSDIVFLTEEDIETLTESLPEVPPEVAVLWPQDRISRGSAPPAAATATDTPTPDPLATETPLITPSATLNTTLTPTNTLLPGAATFTPTKTATPSKTPKATVKPPTATKTKTPIPGTATNTPTKTNTPTQTNTPTDTSIPTDTHTPLPPTDTPVPPTDPPPTEIPTDPPPTAGP
jgi:hypothetical protein